MKATLEVVDFKGRGYGPDRTTINIDQFDVTYDGETATVRVMIRGDDQNGK
jgi:hypothetical protein